MEIRRLTTLAEMLPNLSLIQELTTALTAEGYETMLQEMIPHNYFQAGVYEADNCVAVSGYWIGTKLYSGKYLEIDNFVVDIRHRDKGIGKMLVDWMVNEARQNACKFVMLDAYVENFKAHHFYYREGFFARGYHYLKPLFP